MFQLYIWQGYRKNQIILKKMFSFKTKQRLNILNLERKRDNFSDE